MLRFTIHLTPVEEGEFLLYIMLNIQINYAVSPLGLRQMETAAP